MSIIRVLGVFVFFSATVYSSAFYNPQVGRWLSRDSLDEVPGPNLYALVFNRPISLVDKVGQSAFSSILNACLPKCGGTTYNPIKNCCCNGVTYSRSAISTGIKLCVVKANSGAIHQFLDVDGLTAGFSATGDVLGGPGVVDIPDTYAESPYKTCVDIKQSPCDVNIQKLKMEMILQIMLSYVAPPPYNLLDYNCGTWVNNILNSSLAGVSGSCGLK